jgi:hypothetical protein
VAKIRKDSFEAARNIDSSSGTEPTLADVLRDIADDLLGVNAVPAWQTPLAVSAHTLVLPNPGVVVAVEALAGSSAGPKAIINTATPAAGRVRVVYSATGIPTLTFNTADAITSAAVSQLVKPTLKTTKA